MAVTTRTVCDACGTSIRNKQEPKELILTLNGIIDITMDVHPNARCASRAVRTALEKHFNVNGATPE